jgi:PAS domain S-box-containing protein
MSEEIDLRVENQILRERLARAEDELALALRAVVEHVPAFLAVITPEGRMVATGRTSEAFGSVIGRSVFEFTAPEEHGLMRDVYARACATRQPQKYESTAYGENGEPNHSFLVQVIPIVEDDAVARLVLLPTDITERVRLERSLGLSEQKLRLAVDAAQMGLWSWNIPRNEVQWDQRSLEIFGTSVPPRDYDRYMALVHPDDRALVGGFIERALTTGSSTPFEHRLAPRGDGIERWTLCTSTVLRDEAGAPAQLMGGVLDITAQKHATAHLRRAQRVEALGQLSAGLAHNFNNLLGAIIPNVELALEHASPEQEASLSAALGASIQARDLIKRLMAVTAPRVADAPRSCDPRDVVERAVELCRHSFPRQIEIAATIDPRVGHVRMDAGDLDQVVLNLLFNARDALEPVTGRERRVEIVVEPCAAADGRNGRSTSEVCLRVRDNGVGMAEDVAGRIFEPFFTTKPAHRGAGLGLADVLVRVRDANGRLDCQSALGVGTTFTVVLPATAPVREPASAGASRARGSGGETILIVDDEAALRAVVGRLLTRRGYRVLEASGAEEARAVLRERAGEVRLVLLDQSMPQETGPEALPSLKQLSDAPVVLFTGGITSLPPGAAALLEKPAQAEDLLRLVQDLIAPAA